MKILQLIGTLIDYPTQELHQNVDLIKQMVTEDSHLSDAVKDGILKFVDNRLSMDLLDWQAEYDGSFERGRNLSLLLFEHVHGESRDRGQAMVDLLDTYKQAGLDIGVNELPDHIPLYLEFLSTQGEHNARGWLQDVAHIFGLLASRLKKREMDYEYLFNALIELSGVNLDLSEVDSQVAREERDDTAEALDKVWEEEAITFGGDAVSGGCPTAINKPTPEQSKENDVPIQWVEAAISDSHNALKDSQMSSNQSSQA